MRSSGGFRTFNIAPELVAFAKGDISLDDLIDDNLQCNIDF